MKITSIKPQEKVKNRYSIFVDGQYTFSLSENSLLESGITSGREITRQQIKEFKKLSVDDKAYNLALRYIVMRPRSEQEMNNYLKRKKIEEESVKSILNKLSKLDLINDEKFAMSWVENRRLLKSVSRRRLSQELRQKHISSDIIEKVLAEDKEQTDERVVLAKLIEKKRTHYPDDQKLMAYLARQGYGYDDIKSVLSSQEEN